MSASTLTKHTPGGMRELTALFLPLFLSLVSSNLMLFCDRLFLARHSLEALNAVTVAGTLTLFFQAICIRTLMINQVYVAEGFGSNHPHSIGPATWQMIWAALLTLAVTLPIGLVLSPFYFAKTEVAVLGSQYFFILMVGNFLFPLGTVLSTFLIGLGRTKTLTLLTCIANGFNIVLDYLLILKFSFGVQGAAVATLVSQGLLCLVLLIFFLSSSNRRQFSTQHCLFKPSLFWEMIKTGAPRGISVGINLLSWSLCVYILSHLGGAHLLVLSFGGSIWVLLSALSLALSQGLLTQLSYYLGKMAEGLFWKSFRSSIKILVILIVLLIVPLGLFSHRLIPFILSHTPSPQEVEMLKVTCRGIIGYFFVECLSYLTSNILVAMKKTVYLLKVSLFGSALATFLPYYIGFYLLNWSPDKIWFANWFCCILAITLYLIKINYFYRKHSLLPSASIKA
ncbi:MAG: polysaccharide biosynthesis C-terminal domain-containing protein [Chlamydiia bacterium]|nr:polysaccharide biosynthesis C-terminal domain-containing protein [Chlamydiia bacterium]